MGLTGVNCKESGNKAAQLSTARTKVPFHDGEVGEEDDVITISCGDDHSVDNADHTLGITSRYPTWRRTRP